MSYKLSHSQWLWGYGHCT